MKVYLYQKDLLFNNIFKKVTGFTETNTLFYKRLTRIVMTENGPSINKLTN